MNEKIENPGRTLGGDTDRRDLDGEFLKGLLKSYGEGRVGFDNFRDFESERGMGGQAGFLAGEPIELGSEGDWGSEFPVGRRGESSEEDGFLLVSVADEGWEEDFIWEGELEGGSGEAGWEFPFDGGGHTGIARVGPVDVPAGGGSKTETHHEGLTGLERDRLGNEVDCYLRGAGERASPSGSKKKKGGKPAEIGPRWGWEGHGNRIG